MKQLRIDTASVAIDKWNSKYGQEIFQNIKMMLQKEIVMKCMLMENLH